MENIFITIMQQHLQNMNIKIISLPTENKFKFL